MDQFIAELTDTLSKYDEDVVLVMYGDHIPALDVTEEHYDEKNLYQTEYVIWSNFEMEKEDNDLAGISACLPRFLTGLEFIRERQSNIIRVKIMIQRIT